MIKLCKLLKTIFRRVSSLFVFTALAKWLSSNELNIGITNKLVYQGACCFLTCSLQNILTQKGLTSDSAKGKGERHFVYASVWPLCVLSHFCLYFHSYLPSGPNYCFNMICNMHFQYTRSEKGSFLYYMATGALAGMILNCYRC